MADEDLGEVLDESYLAHKREVAIKVLGERTHLSMERITKLLDNPTHGAIIKLITLQDLLDAASAGEADEADEADEPIVAAAPSAPPRKKAAKPAKAAKAAKAAKPAKAAKAAKKATKKKAKKAPKKVTKKKAKGSSEGKKADYGTKKPRLNYEVGCKEVLSALRAIKAPASNGQIVATTNYTPVQVRAFLKRLQKDKKVKVQGTGKATKYKVA